MGFLNLNGGRRELKWTELYRTLREDDISLFAVAETHLRELEEPPAHSDWCWAGCNRAGQGRKGGGIGFLWRRDLQWRRQEGACSDHLWVFGDLRGIPVAVCVVYLAVNTKHRDENVQSLECVRRDARQWATDRELIILGDFNGHLSELDGHTDFNGRLVLGLAEDMQLSILNLDQRCVGQVTWCARGSATTIDYALISHGLDSACRMCTVDEEGLRSVGSDHNRLCLQFGAAGFRKRNPQRKDRGKYLPSAAVGKVCEDFEVSPRRHAATSYEDFVQALREVIERHMVQDRRSDEARKNPWWDEEVETAWKERRRANRAHRLAIKTGCAEAVPARWAQYIELKRKVQALVQAKLAEHNMSLFRSLHSDGKSTAQRFWRYVTSLDRPAPPPCQLRDVASGRSILNLKEHLTEHFTRVFQDPDPPADLCGGQKEDIPPDSTSARSREESTHYAFSGLSVDRALAQLRARTAMGLDSLPARLLKNLGPVAREQLADLFTGIIEGAPIPEDWRLGRITLVPKQGGNPAHLGDHRPLTVTSVVYRLFASILKDWLSGWVEAHNLLTELQNGFRRGRRLDDNLFVLTQCTEIARKEGRSLLCCFLDVEKAYDSVPHALLFKRLARMGIPGAILDTIQRLYEGNSVVVKFGGVQSARIPVAKGLRQGCPLSPLLYILYAADIERELLKSGLGFGLRFSTRGIDDSCRLPGLAFADDLVVMAESSSELQVLLDICHAEVTKLGLRFNTKKTAVVRLAGGQNANSTLSLAGKPLATQASYKYLGVWLGMDENLYSEQEEKLRQSALRAQGILRRRVLWGCNRFTMVRELWKLVHVPALTFANAVVCLSSETREWLERRQREVGRTAVGCHGTVANEAVQGDVGWSSFEAREASSKLVYKGRLLFMSRERWARRVFEYLSATCLRTKWTRRMYRLEQKYGLSRKPVEANSATLWTREVRLRVCAAEEEEWRRSCSEKSSLALYRAHKRAISSVRLYDNSLGSTLLFEARAGALRTRVRQKRLDDSVEDVLCRACVHEEETMEHVVLQCDQLGPDRKGVGSDGNTPLHVALGFEEGGSVDMRAVARTKCRLEMWKRATLGAQ